ncbi:MAG: tRNA (adenosine(37)-N6)-threonylcarbamoyltransferase complex ATPase subunit type 1 TsaE [Firmicutes bacterium]|nr:tRNA (adenosine(37)-N6)-threonylcarbamoyltransferase complex ATPase subunit type 1 TsaE [Bacillota bacterium]
MVIIMNFKYTSKNENDTMTLAQNFESEKFPNMVICLDGELGSGKTVFVKGFARALGIEDNITSPTFNLIKEYDSGELPLYHMDVYRLEEGDESVGVTEYYNKGGITIIEWSDIIKDKLPEERVEITFKFVDENTRVLYIVPYGSVYEELCESVL